MLGAGEFLAVNQEDGFVAPVDHQQLRDGAVGGDFCDDEVPGGEGFPEGAVLESAVRRGDERHDGDVFVRLRFPELTDCNRDFTAFSICFLSLWAKGRFAGFF